MTPDRGRIAATLAVTALLGALAVHPTAGAGPEPTLGQPWPGFQNQEGYGQVRPAVVFNGGGPTGRLADITWSSWGGPTATGTGTGYEAGANPRFLPMTIIAWDLGECAGKPAYRAATWLDPAEGKPFDPATSHWNICTGDPVG